MNLILEAVNFSNKENAEKILSILKENYSNVANPATIESVSSGKVKYFWAKVDDQIVGISGYMHVTKTLVETVKTVVLKDFRGRGLGSLISQAIEEYCVKNGAHKIRTTIYSHNISMINIKLKQGYTIEGFHPDHEAPGFHEYSLGKVFKGL